MATNEHFLLVHLSDLANAPYRSVYSTGEVIRSVKNARTLAELSVGSKTDSLIIKALRKLGYNGLVNFVECGGQQSFRITPRGFSEIKRAIQECLARKRCPSQITVPPRARDVLRIGAFLKKRLIRDSDDILEDVRKKLRTMVDMQDFSIVTDDPAISYLVTLEGHSTLPSPVPSPPSTNVGNADHPPTHYPRLASGEPSSEDFKPGREFEDLVSESEAQPLPYSPSESEFDSCALSNFHRRGSSTFSMSSLVFQGDESEESKQAALLGVSADLDPHQTDCHENLKIKKVHRKDSFDSDHTVVESSSAYDNPFPTLADIKPGKVQKTFSAIRRRLNVPVSRSGCLRRDRRPLVVEAKNIVRRMLATIIILTVDSIRAEKCSSYKSRALLSYWG